MAQLKNTTINDTGFLNLPAGTTVQRPASPSAGMMRYNTTLERTEYYTGTAWRSIADTFTEASGGTIFDTEIGGVPYRIHYFTATGNSTFTVTRGGEVEYLIVAGGGGGSNYTGSAGGRGGAGAGGVLTGVTTVSPQAYTITVGAGGLGNTTTTINSAGSNGGNSSAFGLTTTGGGAVAANIDGISGGSGAGGSLSTGGDPGGISGSGGTGVAGQGNSGAHASNGGANVGRGGGGGGAGAPGSTGQISGHGGAGIASTISGSVQFYGGGAGGNGHPDSAANFPGRGGVGGGANGVNIGNGFSGVPNTGGGGGSGGVTSGNIGGNGGSGVVIIRYKRNQETSVSPTRTIIASPFVTNEIVRDGLIAHIDPANPSCYPGSGSTVFDLSGRGANGTINGNVTFSTEANGCFIFGGADADDISSSLSQDYQDFTMFFQIAPNAKSFFGVLATARASTNLDDAFRGGNEAGVFSLVGRNPGDVNDWAAPTATTYYVNGSPSNIGNPGWNCWGGFRTNRGFTAGNSFPYHLGTSAYVDRNFTGKIGVVLLYSRQLSAAEQLQNFNALRWRYGI